MAPMFRFMVIDEDGHRVGRFETADANWRAGEDFALDEQMWRIVEILPEVSTMVAYNAVWVAAPAVDQDEHAALDGWPMPDAIRRAPRLGALAFGSDLHRPRETLTQCEISRATVSEQPVSTSASTVCQSMPSSTALIAS